MTSARLDISGLRAQYQAQKNSLLHPLLHDTQCPASAMPRILRALSDLTQNLLVQLWQQAQLSEELALVAVGGFGRGELFPHSDVDVLLLLPNECCAYEDPELKERIETFIGFCWDAGLEIGSSVRTLNECIQESTRDITIQTALLESRLLAGNSLLFAQFEHQFAQHLDVQAFFVAKTLEMRQRHHKFENTPYALEPNCKESPGGLRDLHILIWVARAAGYGRTWEDLAANALITEFERAQLTHAQDMLSLIRARLHLIARRREDRLVFDLQTAVADSFGFETPKTPPSNRFALKRISEILMRRYYWVAKAVSQLHQILMLNIEERLNPTTHQRIPINERFFDKAGMLEVASDDLYRTHPHAVLETFLVYQKTMGLKGLSARTLRALYNARDIMHTHWRRDEINRHQFLSIFQQPAGLTRALRLMNHTSVLGRTLWPFRRIVGQMQHDLFHVYTVDQHILMVVRNMRRFFMPEHAHEYPFCSQLAAGWDKPWLLYIAALFHDIAKGRGGDHSVLGAIEVRRFARWHRLEKQDADLIAFLVEEHLCMSQTAQKEDLSNPDVIARFAQRVGNERRLTALYLLTVADIRGTSPKVWNAWKGKLLEDLYRTTLHVFGGRAPDRDSIVQARQHEALILLSLHAQPFESHKALWSTLDVSYFMRHEPGDIAWHARQISRLQHTSDPVVRSRQSPLGEGLQVLVYTRDQPDLFARICGYFDKAGFSILDAKIHTTTQGYALDTFQIITPELPDHYRELTHIVQDQLSRTLKEAPPLPRPSQARVSRRVRNFPIAPHIDLRPDEKGDRWLLNISASDRQGLLYRIARVLTQHHISVLYAKVTTLGERVEDTFLLEGEPLQDSRLQLEIETELFLVLAEIPG